MSNTSNKKPKLIVIVGPNSSGKTSLSIKLAKKFNGEVISADSRQVYIGMDIGTGKVTKKEAAGIKHFLIDVASPKNEYNVTHFKKDATKAIEIIISQGKMPLLVGGTGFWIRAIIDDLDFPAAKPNTKLRAILSKKTPEKLYLMLKKLDPIRAKSIDKKNPYRLIRAIEILKATKKPIPKLKKKNPYQTIILGIRHPKEKRIDLIHKRLILRLKNGMINEVKRLHQQGVSWKRMEDIGLEYRFISRFLRKKISREEMVEQLENAIIQFAKRQNTWFKKDKRIIWLKNNKQAINLITKFNKK